MIERRVCFASRRLAVALAAAFVLGCGDPGDSSTGLRAYAARLGLSIGSAAHHEYLATDPPYGKTLAHEFDSLTRTRR